ncbi:hypothetical protein LZC95_20980 [Pendulispora brunnea]|uniref:Uncharacterized protein n=1 Tax=Pendulispora brunnea TaxID=2905690 RepID=A0ABZ2KKU7_9BACT
MRVIGETADILRRHFEIAPEELEGRTDWATVLSEASHRMALRALGGVPDLMNLDALVVVSSSFFGYPGLARRLQVALRLPEECTCLDIGNAGCVGATQGWYVADALLQRGHRRVCVVASDAVGAMACSPIESPSPSVEEIVARCLGSDGAAAVVLHATDTREKSLFAYRACKLRTRLWGTETLDWNVLRATQNSLDFRIAKEIRDRVVPEASAILKGDPGTVFLHPGGRALLDHLQDAGIVGTELARTDLEDGNFGSSAVLRVLARGLERGVPLESTVFLVTFGPGKATSVLELQGVG